MSKYTLTNEQLDEIIQLIPGYNPLDGIEGTGLWFDYDAARDACDFFPEFLTHVKGELAGQPFVLEPWEQAILANLFGWKRADGTRRFREALIFVARKNGKSPFGAGIALLVFITDGEPGAEIYSAAAEAEQAGLIFNMAVGMVNNDEDLASRVQVYKRSMVLRDDPMSVYRYISADAKSKHGYNTHLGLVDELHVCERELIEVLDTSTGARRQPLLLYFTTSDYQRESICNEKYDYASRVRDGEVDDLYFLPVIYEISKEDLEKDPDCWKKEEYWRKANPNLGVSKNLVDLERQCMKAQESPAFQNEFMRLHGNIRTETETRWITSDKWRLNDGPLDISLYEGKECAGAGLDLGNTSDLTSLCLDFDNADGGHDYFWWNWMPRVKAQELDRKRGVPFVTWARDGWLTLTDGNEIDYAEIRAAIVDIGTRFGIPNIAVDRLFQGAQLCQDLAGEGFEVTEFGQGWASMTVPMVELMERICRGEARHGDDPVARWCSGNITAIMKTGKTVDSGKALSPGKTERWMKIDPLVTMIMATGIGMSRERTEPSVYETRGMIRL